MELGIAVALIVNAVALVVISFRTTSLRDRVDELEDMVAELLEDGQPDPTPRPVKAPTTLTVSKRAEGR